MGRMRFITWFLVVLLSIAVGPGAVAAQIPGDFPPGAFFTLSAGDGVYVTDPNVTPRQSIKVMPVPNVIAESSGWGYDMVRHLIYPIVSDLTGRKFLLKIDPVNKTTTYVKELIPNSPNYCDGSQITYWSPSTWVDASTGYVFCTHYILSASSPPGLVIVRVDPDTGQTETTTIETTRISGPAIAVNPTEHALYVIRGITTQPAPDVRLWKGELVKIDTRTMEKTSLGIISDDYVHLFFNIVYDAPSNSLFGYNEHCYNPIGDPTKGQIYCNTEHKLWKLNLNTMATPSEVKIGDFAASDGCRYGPKLGIDELHHFLYVNACTVVKKVDISKSDLILVDRVFSFNDEAFNDGVVRQVILLDWTNASSTGWKLVLDTATGKREVVQDPTGTSSVVATDSATFRQPILDQVRALYAGNPASEADHFHFPILDYTGPKRSDESAHHAVYVRFVQGFDTRPSKILLGQAWDISSPDACGGVDQFNVRKSGEVAAFIDPSGVLGISSLSNTKIVAATVTHEVGHALGLRHTISPGVYPDEIMDYGPGTIEFFSRNMDPIREPPLKNEDKPSADGFVTNNHRFHLRYYGLGEPLSSPAIASLQLGDWDRRPRRCGKILIASSSGPPVYSFTILNPVGNASFDGAETLAYRDSASSVQGVEAVFAVGNPIKVVASSVPNGDWDLYFVPANDPGLLEIPGTALVPGLFNGKIMKYSAVTKTFSEVGSFSMNISEFETPTPPGSPLPPNNEPVANAGPDQTLQLPVGATSLSVTLNGSGSSDVDGDPLTYFWSGPFGVLTGATVSADVPAGRHVVTLGVSDGKGGSSSDTATITVNVSTNIPGDFDGDRDVDLNDWKMLARDLNKPVQKSICGAKCDLTGDGKITILDAHAFAQLCTRPFCRTEKFKNNQGEEDLRYKELLQMLK